MQLYHFRNQPCQLNGNVFRIRIDAPACFPSSTSLSRDTVDLVPSSDAVIIDSATSRRSEIGYQMNGTSHNLCHNTPQSRTNQAYLSYSSNINTFTTYRDLPVDNVSSNSVSNTHVPTVAHQTSRSIFIDTHETNVTHGAQQNERRTSANPEPSRAGRSDYTGACAVMNGYVISPPPYREVVNSCNRLPSIVVARQNQPPRRHLQFSL